MKRWNEDGASKLEAQLLAAAKRERASDELHASILAATPMVVTAAGAKVGFFAGWTGKIGLAAFVGAGAMLAYLATRPERSAPIEIAHGTVATIVTTTTPVAATSVPPVESGEPAIAIEDLPRAAVSAATAKPASSAGSVPNEVAPSDDPVTRERLALDRAREFLAHGDAHRALQELDAYRDEFPHGMFEPEERVVRVRALVALGDSKGAQTIADEFARAHPSSPYASRLRALASGEKK
jgi:hypothetical protein